MERLVDLVKRKSGARIDNSQLWIDATVGNGWDTLFLAERVAAVIGFDIQEKALENTQKKLDEAGLSDKVHLNLKSHELMSELVPDNWRKNVSGVIFNLGYLPGADKDIVTRNDTTLAALDASTALLRKGGLISIMLYRGHSGGEAEANAVQNWISESLHALQVLEHVETPNSGPVWVLLRKKR